VSVAPSASEPRRCCPLCGVESIRSRFRYDGWEIAHCDACGLGVAQPLLTDAELRDLYTEEYFDGRFNPAQNYLETGDDRQLWEATLNWIESRTRVGRLLDVGCGCGFFLRAAAERGWSVAGFDASQWAATHVRQTFGIDVRTGQLDTAGIPEGSYDVVTLWSTLEHVPDPWATLERVATFLRPGGMLCIGVPNYRGWGALLHGAKESNFKREHLYYFTLSTLQRSLERAGFTQSERMVIYGGEQHSLPRSVAQYLLRRFGWSNQLMLAAKRPELTQVARTGR
jgi:2-polyprenyl-3-methyl-5-hydroxy-6-metoxy-1,4-benzoquinol methylase